MWFVLAVTATLVSWIVLWALDFGRTGDAFIVSLPILLLSITARLLHNKLRRPE
jgi:hypothetical protein